MKSLEAPNQTQPPPDITTILTKDPAKIPWWLLFVVWADPAPEDGHKEPNGKYNEGGLLLPGSSKLFKLCLMSLPSLGNNRLV